MPISGSASQADARSTRALTSVAADRRQSMMDFTGKVMHLRATATVTIRTALAEGRSDEGS
jgi:hypothetical protein